MDYGPPASPVHGILQAIILKWVAISFSRESSQPRDEIQVSHIVDRHLLYRLSHQGSRSPLLITWPCKATVHQQKLIFKKPKKDLRVSLVAQLVKNLPAMRETWFDLWVGKIPWRRERPLLQYSGLEKSMDCIAYGVAKSRTQLTHIHTYICRYTYVYTYTHIELFKKT